MVPAHMSVTSTTTIKPRNSSHVKLYRKNCVTLRSVKKNEKLGDGEEIEK
jgi:hypothetical protein